MTKNLRRAVLFIGALALLPGSPLVVSVGAYQCAELTEHVDMWDDSEEDNDTLGFFARGVAESGDPCNATVRTYILAPDGSEVASAIGNGIGTAESTAVIYLDDTWPQGDYTGKSEAWSQGVHYGCAVKFAGIAFESANYIKSFDQSGYTFVGYLRCADGPCPQAFMKRSKCLSGVCSQYARLTSIRADYQYYFVCLFLHPVPIPSCSVH